MFVKLKFFAGLREFLPPDEDFQAVFELDLVWKSSRILRSLTAELRPDGDTVILRDKDQPAELYRVPRSVLDIAELPMELFQDRMIFPLGDEFRPTLSRWEYRPQTGDVVILERLPAGTLDVDVELVRPVGH